MSPLADTVCFVDGYETHFYFPYNVQKILIMEPFWCDVDKFNRCFSRVSNLFQDITLLLGSNGRIDTYGGDSSFSKFIDLIFHERDEWGYDDSNSGQSYSRDLVGQTFTATCGHKYHGVMPGYYAPYNILLSFTEALKPECFFEDIVNI